MFSKILIANRGEIACRIAATATRLGIETVAVASDADRDAVHAQMCDACALIGGHTAIESYLSIDKLLRAASEHNVDAVHPGYGFLAESADFADACAGAGLTFIGPSPQVIRDMGLKDKAKALAREAGVPVVPGAVAGGQDGEAGGIADLAKEASKIGYPVLVKALAGGGGRGMRLAASPADLEEALESARREAAATFGDSRVMLEKYIERPRHIEVQLFGDKHGNVVHLFERDCSLQRRHQKVIEEAPAPGISKGLRRRMTEAAVALARSVDYQGAGTVEFLVPAGDGATLPDIAPFYFIEMNTRLQVEHPVTEAITGLDLVEWQFRVAAGETLPLAQEAIRLRGHAIEARLYAEDPAREFRPSVGRLEFLTLPGESVSDIFGEPFEGEDEEEDGDLFANEAAPLRLDEGVEEGDEITPYYDPLLAKLTAFAETRSEALDELSEALEESVVVGPATNLYFLHCLLSHPDVQAGIVHTGLIDAALPALMRGEPDERALHHALEALLQEETERYRGSGNGDLSPWDRQDGFQLGGVRSLERSVLINGVQTQISLIWGIDGLLLRVPWSDELVGEPGDEDLVDIYSLKHGQGGQLVFRNMRQFEVRWAPIGRADEEAEGRNEVVAPLTGRLGKLFVKTGDNVERGGRVAILEAMKMEHVLNAEVAGTVQTVLVDEGDQVSEGDKIVQLAPARTGGEGGA